jgi:hypothetical protein
MPRARTSVAVLSLVAFCAGPVVAQDRPNFNGKWTLVPDKSLPANPNRPIVTLTITQDDKQFTSTPTAVAAGGGAAPVYVPSTYVTDGEEHQLPLPSAPAGGAIALPPNVPPGTATVVMTVAVTEQTYRAAWTKDQLVMTIRTTSTTTSDSRGETKSVRVSRRVYSIDAEGFLVVETTPVEPVPATPPPPNRNVYRKN